MSIGQDKLAVVPLQMAEVAAAVGNGGTLMTPHIASRIVNSEGQTVTRVKPSVQSVVMKHSTASAVRTMMEAVVTEGTGTSAQIPGVQVAGKTGTAETQIGTAINNVWFIAFAPASNPTVAIAVTLKGVPGQGAAFAAPVARQVMEQLLRDRARDTHRRPLPRALTARLWGMADVYLAHDQLLGREVAVKVLHHHFAEDQEFVERFKREASSAAALSHPNIVGIFDRGEWNGTYYIAMEYVAGRSLKALVSEETGPLDPALAIDTVIQILRAARFAHRRGVIHRDLKPHNVILDEEGRARVTDFGIARAGASDMTLTGSIMGTAQYLSPEQAQGYAVSAASDIYSVGVILYELLTGVVPFEGETAVAIAFKQVSAVPRPPSELNPALPRSLDAVVLRALAKDPIERYADDDELIAALETERERLPGAGSDGHAPAPYDPPTGVMLAAAAPVYEERAPEEAEKARAAGCGRVGGTLLALAIVAAAVLLLGGKGTVGVPDVTGQTEQAADGVLRRAGLNPVPQLQPSSTVPTGVVISQAPEAGKRCSGGSRVTLIVSGGPASAPVTDVEGSSEQEALKKLRKAGFKPRVTKQASSTVAAGKVIGTNPPAGGLEQLGSGVEVLVSSGPRAGHSPRCDRPVAFGGRSHARERRARTRHRDQTRNERTAAGHGALAVAVERHLGQGQRARSNWSWRRGRKKSPSRTWWGRARGSRRAPSKRRGSGSPRRRVRPPKRARSARCCASSPVPARSGRRAPP